MQMLTKQEQENLRKLHASWPLCFLPDAVKPYAELIRISKPAGTAMFYFPFLYGTCLSAALDSRIQTMSLLQANARLVVLAFLMRGALCTWNDILDQDLDRQVTRTRIRPLARRAVSVNAAVAWLMVQTALIWTCFVVALPEKCARYSIPCFGLHFFYPFMKRITHYPQLWLGFAFAATIPVALPALGQDLSSHAQHDPGYLGISALGLFIVFWTLLFDTVYAAQDVEDDKKAGIGSTMVLWESEARNFLRALAASAVIFLLVVSYVIRQTSFAASCVYSAITCGIVPLALGWMSETLDLKDIAGCGWWFGSGSIYVGLLVGSGLIAAHAVQQVDVSILAQK